MPLCRIGHTILYFAHVPKTGGTSVAEYLKRKGAVALLSKDRLGWSTTTAQHMEAHVHRCLVPDGFIDASFTVLRDPVARMISEYRYRMDLTKQSLPFSDFVAEAFEAHSRSPRKYDNHIRPQSDFLRPGMSLFRLEDGLDEVFDWIDRVTDTPAAARGIREKTSRPVEIEIPPTTRDAILRFYRVDIELLERLKAQRK